MSQRPSYKSRSIKPVVAIMVLLFIAAAAVGVAFYGTTGALIGVAIVLFCHVVSFERWSRWAVVPEKKLDRRAARRQLKKLRRRRRSVRWRAANKLRAVGPDSAPIVPEILACLGEADPLVRSHLCEALGAIGPAAREAVPALIDLLKDDPFSPAIALGRIGPEAAASVPLLIAHLQAPRGNCETIVAIALWRIEQKADRFIPVLVEVLHSESAPLRRSAAHAFCEIDPAAKDARPALTQALTDTDRWVRKTAAKALERIPT